MRLMVTGGRGFIGSHFVEKVLEFKNVSSVIDYDCMTYAASKSLPFDDNPKYEHVNENIQEIQRLPPNIDYIVNFAAESHVDNSIASPSIFIESNVLGVYNLLELIRGKVYSRPHFIHISTDEVYSATAGGGAFCNGKPLHVSETRELHQSLLATGFPYTHDQIWSKNMEHFKLLTDLTQGVRRGGAAALDFCHVARGWLDGFWEYQLGAWDMAAGVLIVQEAGGKVSQMNHQPFVLMEREVVVSNGLIHQELLDNLNR